MACNLLLSKLPAVLHDLSFDWAKIKFVSRKLKQKARSGSHLVDEKYEALEFQFNTIETQLKALQTNVVDYQTQFMANMSVLGDVAESARYFFDPFLSLPRHSRTEFQKTGRSELSDHLKRTFAAQFRVWEAVTKLEGRGTDVVEAVESELKVLAECVLEKVELLLKVVNGIRKTMKKRQSALLDYDLVYYEHEKLAIIRDLGGDLDPKQSQRFLKLESKLQGHRRNYDEISDCLKEELPLFVKLSKDFLVPIVYMVYYVQLMVSYQSVVKLNNSGFEIDSRGFLESLTVKPVRNSAVDEVEGLGITNSLDVDVVVEVTEYCVANFSFEGQQKGDLRIYPGDVIKVVDRSSNWWRGEVDGKAGVFPGNYVRLI